jgi:hypothetical protein
MVADPHGCGWAWYPAEDTAPSPMPASLRPPSDPVAAETLSSGPQGLTMTFT